MNDSECAAELLFALNSELRKVEAFYNAQYREVLEELSAWKEQYHLSAAPLEEMSLENVDQCDLRNLLACLVESLKGLESLQWYGKLNRDGCDRIFKKIIHVRHTTTEQFDQVWLRFAKSNFATQSQCLHDIAAHENLINYVTNAHKQSQFQTPHFSLPLRNRWDETSAAIVSPDEAYVAIVQDDVSILDRLFPPCASRKAGQDHNFGNVIDALQEVSISQGAQECTARLLPFIAPQAQSDLRLCGNFIHRLSANLGRDFMLQKDFGHMLQRRGCEKICFNATGERLLVHIIDHLEIPQLSILEEKDFLGRLPLHYVAQHGMTKLCQAMLRRLHKKSNRFLSTADVALMQDRSGYTPLHRAVIGGHLAVTQSLLEVFGAMTSVDQSRRNPNLHSLLGSLLTIAVRSNFIQLVRLLITHGVDVNHRDVDGESALFSAARNGSEYLTKALLESSNGQKIDMNTSETTHGWSPLIIACIEGHQSIVEMLLRAGASPHVCDQRGWNAKDHAAYRGNMKIVALFKDDDADGAGIYTSQRASSSSPLRMRDHSIPSCNTESQVLVTLGPSNTRKPAKAVDLSPLVFERPWINSPELGYSLKVEAAGKIGLSQVFQLPKLADTINEPLVFPTKDPNNLKIYFSIFRTGGFDGDAFIGRGIGLLGTFKHSMAPKHESLHRDFTIPILGQTHLEFIGSVTFSFLVITPFQCPGIMKSPAMGFWEGRGRTQVVGHRGSGSNTTARTKLQIGENTVQSFLTAVDLGASCVEFDVQLTKDFTPVIFHDFLVMGTGSDTSLCSMTLDQFMHVGQAQAYNGGLPAKAGNESVERSAGQQPRLRSRSVNLYDDDKNPCVSERMKFTEEGMKGSMKGNIRGCSIQEPACTLEQLLTQLPESVAFNIEFSECSIILSSSHLTNVQIEYPMLWEAEDRAMEPYAFELNSFVDKILNMVYRLAGDRNITFSSFSPEICIHLTLKQRDFPILFINKAGSVSTGDTRAYGLQQAIHFAKTWNLAGIVMLSDPFVMCPKLVGYARSSGLVCGSYGNLNDDPKCAIVCIS